MLTFENRRTIRKAQVYQMYHLGVIGTSESGSDGTTPASGRQGKTAEAITSNLMGKYYEANSRGTVYAAGDQGVGIAVTVTITTTATLALHNPVNSQKRLSLLKLVCTYFNGTLGGGSFYHGVLGPGNTLPSSGTSLTSICCNPGNLGAPAAVGVARSAATVVSAAAGVLYPFASTSKILATSAVQQPNRCEEDINGLIILEPGAQYQLLGVFGDAGSSPKVSLGIIWQEISALL